MDVTTPLIFFLFGAIIRSSIASNGFEFFTYSQKINHFGVGGPDDNSTFQQKYGVDDTHWAGPTKNGPILVIFGEESPLRETVIGHIGILTEAAPRLRALALFIEHRFYGSVPDGSIDAALMSPLLRSYLSTEQALADFADIILSVKANLSATRSPAIVMGGSYAGMLVAWFRLKYPHVARGALASSAPVLFFEVVAAEKEVCSVVT